MDQSSLFYEDATPEDYDELLPFLLQHFCSREPLSMSLHMTDEDSVVWVKCGMAGWLASGVSVVARDADTRSLVGCVFGNVLTKGDKGTFDVGDGITNQKAKVLLAITVELEMAVNLFEHYCVEKVLELAMFTVIETHARQGVGRRLVEECERRALSKGCQVATAQCSNVRSQAVCAKAGYETLFELPYEGYSCLGTSLDLAAIVAQPSATTVAKRLIPV